MRCWCWGFYVPEWVRGCGRGVRRIWARMKGRTALGGEGVVADGPYRHMRNPLYLGAWVHTLALALLMPASGALFTVAGGLQFSCG